MVEVWELPSDPELWQRYERNPAYLRILPLAPHEQYVWMERFVADAAGADSGLAAELGAALRTAGAFRSFREVVSRDSQLLQRWRTFRRAQTLVHARAWLQANRVVMLQETARPISADALAAEAIVRIRDRFQAAAQDLPAEDMAALLRLGEFLRRQRACRLGDHSAVAGRAADAECGTPPAALDPEPR